MQNDDFHFNKYNIFALVKLLTLYVSQVYENTVNQTITKLHKPKIITNVVLQQKSSRVNQFRRLAQFLSKEWEVRGYTHDVVNTMMIEISQPGESTIPLSDIQYMGVYYMARNINRKPITVMQLLERKNTEAAEAIATSIALEIAKAEEKAAKAIRIAITEAKATEAKATEAKATEAIALAAATTFGKTNKLKLYRITNRKSNYKYSSTNK